MHVLVTGNTGFIGAQLCNDLVKKGFEVTALSRNQKDSHIISQDGNTANGKLVKCDILQENSLRETFKEIGKVDCVLHLAGQTFRKDLAYPQTYFQSNFIGTLNMLECCRNFNVQRFVFSSSIAVYGLSTNQFTPKYLPVDEKHLARPYDFYDISKYQAEQLCKFYSDRFDIKSVILRYSRVFGPQMIKGLIFQTVKKALSNEPVEVFGDVSTDFVYIDDVVNANIASIEKKLPDLEVFNIGSGEEITLYSICSKIIDLCHSSSKIIFQPEPKSKFSLDISKAKKMLDYQPTEVKEGLIECVEYIKNSIK